MKKESIFVLLMFFFSFLTMVSVFWGIGEVIRLLTHLPIWKLLVTSVLGLVVTFLAGYIILED